jgi:hypothetical protein
MFYKLLHFLINLQLQQQLQGINIMSFSLLNFIAFSLPRNQKKRSIVLVDQFLVIVLFILKHLFSNRIFEGSILH